MNPKRVADLSVLLNESSEAYYWMGFLIADGHFYKRGAIKIHLAEEDRQQLEKFKLFVKYTGRAKSCAVNVMNPLVVGNIITKFGISNRKTYEPVSIEKIKNDELLFSLFVGMLDGDGSVRQRNGTVSAVEMKLHGNWLSKLKFMEDFLYRYFDIRKKKNADLARLRKDGYSLILLTDRQLLALMKKKAIELNLPVMIRKWDMIDEHYVSRQQNSEEKWIKVQSMLSCGCSRKEIAKSMAIKVKSLNVLIWRKTA